MQVVDPRHRLGGLQDREVKEATLLLWKGHCSVHQRFRTEHVAAFRSEAPRRHRDRASRVLARSRRARRPGRLNRLHHRRGRSAPAGSTIAVGTEIHLVDRLARENPDRTVLSLDPLVCPCSTMFRIDLAHLALGARRPRRRGSSKPHHVDEKTAADARVALERMLAIA